MTRPLERALILQVLGDVDVMFAGIDNATGDIILAGQTIVGLADGVDTVSSCGIADIPNWNGGEGGLLAFGDSAVCVDPTSEELASIAISSSETVRSLTGWDIRCALLSHSTDGSMITNSSIRYVVLARLPTIAVPTLPSTVSSSLIRRLTPRSRPRRCIVSLLLRAKPTWSSGPISTWAISRQDHPESDRRQCLRSHASGLQEDRVRLLALCARR